MATARPVVSVHKFDGPSDKVRMRSPRPAAQTFHPPGQFEHQLGADPTEPISNLAPGRWPMVTHIQDAADVCNGAPCRYCGRSTRSDVLGSRHMCRVWVKYQCPICWKAWASSRGRYDATLNRILPQYCGRPGCGGEAVATDWRYLDGNSLRGIDQLQQKLARRALNQNIHPRYLQDVMAGGQGTNMEELACAAYEGFERGNERPLADPTLEFSALKQLAGYWHDSCGPVAFVRGCSFIVFPNEDEVHFNLRFTLPKAFPGGRQAPRGHIDAELFGKPWRAVFSVRSAPLLQIHWNSGDVWRKVDDNPAT